MVFDENSAAKAQAISKTKAADLSQFGVEKVLFGDVTLSITSLEGRFCIAAGVRLPSEKINTNGSVSMYFTNSGGSLAFGISRYGAGGTETVLRSAAPVAGTAYSSPVTVSFAFFTDGRAEVEVNGTDCSVTDTEMDASGYFGFGQTAASNVKITLASVKTYTYDRPENTLAQADFDNGEFNANIWCCKSAPAYYKPSLLSVKDDMLVFENTSDAYIGTLFKYSNLQLDFDIPYIQRTDVFDEAGDTVIKPKSFFIAVYLGAQRARNAYNGINMADGSVLITFQGGYVSPPAKTKTTFTLYKGLKVMQQFAVDPAREKNIFDEAEAAGRTVNMQFIYMDGQLDVFVKYSDEADFGEPVLSHTFEETLTGYVQIASMGVGPNYSGAKASAGNFAIDNIAIENLDVSPVLREIGFISNIRPRVADFVYTDTWNYSDTGISSSGGGIAGSGLPGILYIVAGIILGGIIILRSVKR